MARTKKTETKNTINEVINKIKPEMKVIEWNGISITVKSFLNVSELTKLSYSATDICFTSDETYLPEVYDFAIAITTINVYTDLVVPESVEDQYKLITQTDLLDKIIECIDIKQYEKIIKAIEEKIDYRIETNINLMRKQAKEIFESANSLYTQIKDVFADINPEEFKGMISAFANGGVDETKILKAYMDNQPKE